MLIERGRLRLHARMSLVAGALLLLGTSMAVGGLTAAGAEDVSPREIRESVKSVDAIPQLHRSLQLMSRAMDLATTQITREASSEAHALCHAAYRLQRGAQQGLGVDPVKRRSPVAAETHKHISASRKALLACSTSFAEFSPLRMEQGRTSLQTAISETRVALMLAE